MVRGGGRQARARGSAFERELVKLHLEAGVPAKRVPLSGAQDGWKGDIWIGDQNQLVGEAKKRASGEGFKVLERWLQGSDLLFLRRNRQAPLVCLTFASYLKLLSSFLSSGSNGSGGSPDGLAKESPSRSGTDK